MGGRVEALTRAQEQRLSEWREKWLRTGLRTGAARRDNFAEQVWRYYRAADLPPPSRIVWVDSPFVLSLAAPAAALAIAWAKPRHKTTNVKSALLSSRAVGGVVSPTVGRVVERDLMSPLDRQIGAIGRAIAQQIAEDLFGVHKVFHRIDVSVIDATCQAAGGAARQKAAERIVKMAVGRRDGFYIEPHGVHDGAWTEHIPGQFSVGDVYGSAWASFLRDVCSLRPHWAANEALQADAEICESTAWWWPHHEFVMACEHPAWIDRDDGGRLHSTTRRAIEWPDGWGMYRVHGVAMPEADIRHADRIDVARIDSEWNAERRRVLIDLYGHSKYIEQSGAAAVHEDETGTLYRREMLGDEPLTMVRVVNSTPEPDGSRRIYWLRVPPTTQTAREGVAWTFGERAEDYHPEVQT